MSLASMMGSRAAALEQNEHEEAAADSLARNGLSQHGHGTTHTELGHTINTFFGPGSKRWRMWVSHNSDPDDQRAIVGFLGEGDHDVGERASKLLRHPQMLRAMQDQMKPETDNDGTWPRKFRAYD